MAFETGSYSDQDDLVTKLNTFAVADGWTSDALNTGTNVMALHHLGADDPVYVQFSWNGTSIGVFQSTGYDGSAPGSNPGDSGSGGVGANDRQVYNIGNGSGTYWFFSDWASGQPHVYVVVEYAALTFRHFGFGCLLKANDYTGGAFAYGHYWGQGASDIDAPASSRHAFLLDALGSSADRNGTVHVEGFPDQPGASKWGVTGGHTTEAACGLDGGGNAREPVLGGARAGFGVSALGFTKASMLQGYLATIAPRLYYRDVNVSPERRHFLGTMPEIFVVQMGALEPLEEFAVGGQTWIVVPAVRKRHLLDNTEESWNLGVLYLKDA